MKRFNYKAKDQKTGKMMTGTIQAESERAAGKLLLDKGYIPDKLTEEGQGGILEKLNSRIRMKDKLVFTRQFATLIGAGLPLSNALSTVAEQTQSKSMKAVIEGILASVEAGKTLTESFAAYPDVFDKVYLSLLSAGEKSGTLDVALRRLAAQQEKDAEMMSKIRGALTYPAIVLAVIIAVVIFMMVTVVPQVEGLYEDLGEELPWLTAVLVAISNFIMNFWWLLVIVAAGVVWGIMSFRKTEPGIRFFAVFKLNVPMFKELFLRLYNARFARTAEILLATGVPMLDALDIAGEAINNVVVQEQIEAAAVKVKSGRQLSEGLKDRDYILPLIPQMASIGEQSGKIDEMLAKAAKVYEDELDERIRTLSTMIEPVLMVFLAIVVGGLVGAILFPIYSLVSKIG